MSSFPNNRKEHGVSGNGTGTGNGTRGAMMEMMGIPTLKQDGGTGGLEVGQRGVSQETVPLSSAREDEWGWEEEGYSASSGSTTQSSSHKSLRPTLPSTSTSPTNHNHNHNHNNPTTASLLRDKQQEEEEDAKMALALSLSAQNNADTHTHTSSSTSPPKGLRPPSKTIRSIKRNSSFRSASSASSSHHPRRIPPRPPPSSDIFESMGLTAKPTFGQTTETLSNHPPSSSSSSPPSSLGSAVLVPPSTSNTHIPPTTPKYSSQFVSAVPSSSSSKMTNVLNGDEESSVGTNPNWEDDDDLDDLLGD